MKHSIQYSIWHQKGLNPRPLGCESSALTTGPSLTRPLHLAKNYLKIWAQKVFNVKIVHQILFTERDQFSSFSEVMTLKSSGRWKCPARSTVTLGVEYLKNG